MTTVDGTGHSALAPKIKAKWSLWGQGPSPASAAPCMSAGLDAGVGAHSPQLWLQCTSAWCAHHSRTLTGPAPTSCRSAVWDGLSAVGEDSSPARRISASERPLQAGLWFTHGFAFWPKVLMFVFIDGRWSYFGPRTRFAVIYNK